MADRASELARLKDLLLQPEAARLAGLQERVSDLDERLGTKERLEATTAEILVEAFRQAESRQHRELSRAVAPVVVAAIQSEIKNSRDMMVEALYPITGRLVAAAVANAFRTLVVSINERLDMLLSMRLWQLRLQALISRRPLGELLLAAATRPQLRRLLVLEKGSGVVLGHWSSQPESDDSSEKFGGMIAAITQFSASIFESEFGELRTLDTGGARIFLRGSARTIAAGEFIGPTRPDDEQFIDVELERLIAAHAADAQGSPDDVEAAAHNLLTLSSAPLKAGRSGGIALWTGLALITLLAGAWGWRNWQRNHFETRIRVTLNQAVALRPLTQPYPLKLDIDHTARRISISGLAPSQADAAALRAAVAQQAGDYVVSDKFAIVASEAGVAEALSGLRARLAALSADLAQAISARERDTAADRKTLGELRAHLEILASELENQSGQSRANATGSTRALSVLTAALADLGKTLDSRLLEQTAQRDQQLGSIAARLKSLDELAGGPRAAAEGMIHHTAVFFRRDREFRDPAQAGRMIDQLADLVRAAGIGIRVIGYTGVSGSQAINLRTARGRAELVRDMLVKRGLAPDRIVVVTRPAGPAIDDAEDSDGNSNRRVEFAPLFAGETSR